MYGVDMAQDTLLAAEYSEQRPSCEYFIGLAEGAGIRVDIPGGSDLLGGAGELPPTECWPELWVAEPHQYDRALELVRAMLAIDMETQDAWRCPGCGEPHEGQFSTCWRCGYDRTFAD